MSPETSVPILFVLIRPIKAFAPKTPLSWNKTTFSGKGGLMPQVGLSPIFCLQDSDLISSSSWGVQLCVYLVTQWCPTLSDHPPPQTVARQTPLSMEFSRQDYWSGLPFPPPEDLPNPEIKPVSLESPVLAGGFLTTEPTWEAQPLFCPVEPGQVKWCEQPLGIRSCVMRQVALSLREFALYHLHCEERTGDISEPVVTIS